MCVCGLGRNGRENLGFILGYGRLFYDGFFLYLVGIFWIIKHHDTESKSVILVIHI